MLADQLDYVVGVDPQRDAHALAVVEVRSGGVVFEATTQADAEGYACVLRLVDQHAPGRRAFAVEGTSSFGAGLTRLLLGRGERVLEVGRLRRERQSGKSDALDAIRAAVSPGLMGSPYFEDVADVLVGDGPPDVEKLGEVMRRHGLTPAPPNLTS
jgi:hypothetical protein